MKIERDERRFDFHDIGLAIKRACEASGMTQEQLAYIVDRAPRTIMYNENDGQHPSLNTFYQMVTMFDISVDQYFYPSKNKGSECRKRIDAILNALDEKELKIVEAMIKGGSNVKNAFKIRKHPTLNIIPLGSHQFPASEPSGNGIFHLQSHHNILWQHPYLISL